MDAKNKNIIAALRRILDDASERHFMDDDTLTQDIETVEEWFEDEEAFADTP